MSGLNINPIDTSRDQYFDYGDYISRRHGDRYYNLGYAIYKGIVLQPTDVGYIQPTGALIEEPHLLILQLLYFLKNKMKILKKNEMIYVIFLDLLEP